jgi:PQQ-dependent catabolism-associated CXXCW motif protein
MMHLHDEIGGCRPDHSWENRPTNRSGGEVAMRVRLAKKWCVALIAVLIGAAPALGTHAHALRLNTGKNPLLVDAAANNEDSDYGVSPTQSMHYPYEAPTPTSVPGAKTIFTEDLKGLMNSGRHIVLVDVVKGDRKLTIPGAVWLNGAGDTGSVGDPIQERLGKKLGVLTGGDKSVPVVVFCLSQTCWLSYNASLRVKALGYTNVYWYRGGRDAWKASGAQLTPITDSTW